MEGVILQRAMIRSAALHVPEKVVKNEYFNELYKKDIDSFLRKERNIFARHFMKPEETTSDLILPAARDAIAKAGLSVDEIDLIIVATDTPDYLSPSTASVVQHKLGARHAGVFDVNSACAGFVTALDIAAKYIRADAHYRNILVVGAYGMSKFLNWDDFKIATLFADGAGAVVVSRADDPNVGVLASQLYADGQYHDYMGIYAGGTARPLSQNVLDKNAHLLNFAKKIPIETNTTHWPRIARLLLDRVDAKLADVKLFFFTQINIGLIRATLDALELPHELSHNVMDRYGYTGSACIPMAMADAAAAKKLKKGDLVMVLSSGGGVAMAGMALRWGYDT